MVQDENNLQLITKLVALVVQMKVDVLIEKILLQLNRFFCLKKKRNFLRVKDLFWNYMYLMKPMKT
jgi:hypothetical protein